MSRVKGKAEQVKNLLCEMEQIISGIAAGDEKNRGAAVLEVYSRVKTLREILAQDKEFCPYCGKKNHKSGWKNPASAGNLPAARRGGKKEQ